MIHTRFYRSPEGDGAGAPVRTMADMDNEASNGGITGGDGTPTIPEIPADGTTPPPPAATAPPPPQEGVNADGTIQDGYVKNTDGTVTKAEPAPAEPVEGVNEDGSLQEGYIRDADGTIVKDPDYEAPPAEDFWGVVEKITGVEVKVEYGDVDPVSPEGVALREKAVREDAAMRFEEHLKTTSPRAYAFFLHTASGKPEEEFFSGNTSAAYTLPAREVLDDSVDAQTAVYKYDLRQKGLDDDTIDAIVSKAIKDNKLKERSLAAYGTIEKAQADELAAIEEAQQQLEERYTQDVTQFENQLSTAIDKEISFVVPEAKKPEFMQYVKDRMRYQDGKFFIVQEVGGNTLKNQVESLLFQWNKSDLSKVVARRATTQATQRLSLSLDKSKNNIQKNSGSSNGRTSYIPLGQI